MCNNATFDIIAQVAVEARLVVWYDSNIDKHYRHGDTAQDTIGRLLCDANANGQRDRYRDDESPTVEAYRWNGRAPIASVALLKVCQCYEQQCCEWSQWEGSTARKIVEYVKAHAICTLPGYDAAPWGLTNAYPVSP